jgi:3-deoxy-manno-octulosonate cytidylyltransferase (CMP-KDO synthetase)
MVDTPTAQVVIPARMESSRLPGKVLADIDGKPMLRHVCERSARARLVSSVSVATDSPQVAEHVRDWGFSVHMTSPDAPSGTARIASVLDKLDSQIIVNVQGDEPLIEPELIDEVIVALRDSDAAVATPVYPIAALGDIQDPNVVKVVVDSAGRAMYFSRSPVPYVRDAQEQDWPAAVQFWGHVGLYGFRRSALAAYPALPVGELETSERLEQLRFLEAGIDILTVRTESPSMGVDTPDDLERVRRKFAEGRA